MQEARFYMMPVKPQNLSHQHDALLAYDMRSGWAYFKSFKGLIPCMAVECNRDQFLYQIAGSETR